MTVILFIVLLIYIILYYDLLSKYRKLQISNQKLKKKIKKLKANGESNDATKNVINEHIEVITNNTNDANNNQIIDSSIDNILNKEIHIKKDSKLNWLFAIGISLVCLTYFVLLSSTWSIVSNVIKCLLVILFSLVFFLSSTVLNKIIKVPKAAMVFWILGLIYVPFSLIALFGYGLLGDFLSFNGEGSNICLAIIAIISFILNLLSSIKFKNAFFVWMYILSEFLTIIFGITVFSIDYSIVVLIMSIYIFIVILISQWLKENTDLQYMFKIYNIYKEVILNVFNFLAIINLFSLFINKLNIYLAIMGIIVSFINIYVAYTEKRKLYFNFSIYTFLINILLLFNVLTRIHNFSYYLFIIAIYTTIMNIINMYINNSNNDTLLIFKTSINIFSYISVIFCSINLFGTIIANNNILLLLTLILILLNNIRCSFISKNTAFSFLLVLQITFIISSIFNILVPNLSSAYITIGVLTVIYILSVLNFENKKFEYFKNGFVILIPILIFMGFLGNYNFLASISNNVFKYDKLIYLSITLLMYILAYIKLPKGEYISIIKHFIPILTYILFIVTLNLLTSFSTLLIIILSSTIMIFLTVLFRCISLILEKPFSIISNISIIVGLIACIFSSKDYVLAYYILVFATYIYNSVIYKNEDSGLSNIFKIAYLLISNLVVYEILNILEMKLDINYLTNYSALITTITISLILFIQNKMPKLFIWYLGIFNIISTINLITIPNINIIFKLMPSVSYILLILLQLKELKQPLKDIYKIIIYIIALVPYYTIMNYFNIHYAVLNCIIHLSILYIITRTIIIKHIRDLTFIQWLEITLLILIYIIGLFSSTVTFSQAILFDVLLALIILFSFIKQENSLFKCTSICFILIVFIQTKLVHFPVIWLICLLLFGIGFISFATINELKKTNEISKK